MRGVSRRMLWKRLTVVLFAAVALTLGAAPGQTLASCVAPPPIGESISKATIVFVGTVTATTERDRWATVAVEAVWKGPDLPAVLLVRGGQGGNVATSIDRAFTTGTRYLFVPTGLENGIVADNNCSATRPWDDSLAGLRPADARAPLPGAPAGFDLGGAIAPIGVALLVAGALLVIGLAARSRQRD